MLNKRQFDGLATVLDTSGGFTMNTKTRKFADSGFAVAMPGHEQQFDAPASGPAIQDYAAAKHNALDNVPGNHLGGWREDTASGTKDFLDVTTVFEPHREVAARRATMDRDQIGMFNLNSFETVYNPLHPQTGSADPQFGGIGPDTPDNREFWATAPNRRPTRKGRNGLLGPGKDFQ